MTEKIDTMAGTANDYDEQDINELNPNQTMNNFMAKAMSEENISAFGLAIINAEFRAALREIANLPAHDLGRAIKISREALGIKVGDET